MISQVLLTSKSQEWETPDPFFKKINNAHNLTLDVCASETNHKLKRFFTAKDDGLSKSWAGERVWMNPPYKRKEKGSPGQIDWIRKAHYEVSQNGCELAVCLIPARTDTKLFHDYVMKSSLVFFIRGRLKFVGAPASAVFPSMLVVFDKRTYHPVESGQAPSPQFWTMTNQGIEL